MSVDPELEALLPSTIFEVPLIRGSMSGTVFATGGSDMCIILCSDEVARFAEVLGIDPSDVTVAFAVNERLAPAAFAYRVHGADTAELIPARLEIGGRHGGSPGFPVDLSVNGRDVTLALYSTLDTEVEVLVASGDVLVVLLSEPPTDGTNDFGGELPDYIQTELEQVFDLLRQPGG
jgi:hypothetical protein